MTFGLSVEGSDFFLPWKDLGVKFFNVMNFFDNFLLRNLKKLSIW